MSDSSFKDRYGILLGSSCIVLESKIVTRNKTNEQTKQNENRLLDTENKLVVDRGEGLGGLREISKGDHKVQTNFQL